MRNKLVKILGACALLALLGGGILLWKLDPILESFRPEIERLIASKIQQKVSFGKLSLKLFPSPTARVFDVRLHDNSAPAVHELALKVGLLPLLSKRLEISEVGIDGANLDVSRSADGQIQVNGVSLRDPKEANQDVADAKPSDEKKSIAIEIKKAWLKNSNFRWHNQAVTPAQEITFSNLDLELKDIKGATIAEIAGSGQLLSNAAKNFSLSGSFENGSGKADLKVQSIDLKRLSSVVESYTKKPLPLALEEVADIHANVTFAPPGLVVEASLDADKAGIRLADSFQKPKGDPFSLAVSGKASLFGTVEMSSVKGVLGKNQFEAPFSTDALGESKIHFKSDRISLNDLVHYLPFLAVYRPGGEIEVDVGATITDAKPHDMSGSLTLKDVSAGLASTDPKAPLLISALKGKIALAGSGLNAKEVTLSLAGQPFAIDANVSSLSTPDISLHVQSGEIKLGPLMTNLTGKANPSLESSVMKNLNLAAVYSVAKKTSSVTCELSGGTIASFPLSKTKIVMDAVLTPANEIARATLQPSTISLFGGAATINGVLNEAGQISAVVQAAGIDMKQLLNVVNPGGKISLSGNLQSMTFKASGPKQNFAGAMVGTIDASVSKGAIEGFNLLGQTLGKAPLPGLGTALLAFIPDEHKGVIRGDSTPFNSLKLQAQLNGKDIRIDNLELIHDLYVLTGHGTIPASGDLNLDAQLRLTEPLARGMVLKEAKLKLLLDKNKSIVFPVIITRKGGIFLVFPDLTNLGKRALENTARDAATKALDKVTPGLGNALDSLFR